jgi:hypothetical protein
MYPDLGVLLLLLAAFGLLIGLAILAGSISARFFFAASREPADPPPGLRPPP